MTAVALTDDQLRQIMEIAEAIAAQLRGETTSSTSRPISVTAVTATALSEMATCIVQRSLLEPQGSRGGGHRGRGANYEIVRPINRGWRCLLNVRFPA
jgi:hypothetical protein